MIILFCLIFNKIIFNELILNQYSVAFSQNFVRVQWPGKSVAELSLPKVSWINFIIVVSLKHIRSRKILNTTIFPFILFVLTVSRSLFPLKLPTIFIISARLCGTTSWCSKRPVSISTIWANVLLNWMEPAQNSSGENSFYILFENCHCIN